MIDLRDVLVLLILKSAYSFLSGSPNVKNSLPWHFFVPFFLLFEMLKKKKKKNKKKLKKPYKYQLRIHPIQIMLGSSHFFISFSQILGLKFFYEKMVAFTFSLVFFAA